MDLVLVQAERALTVWKTLHRAGVDPSMRRAGPSWPDFLRSQTHAMILACDLFQCATRRWCPYGGERPSIASSS